MFFSLRLANYSEEVSGRFMRMNEIFYVKITFHRVEDNAKICRQFKVYCAIDDFEQ